jgi:hypothetical protein
MEVIIKEKKIEKVGTMKIFYIGIYIKKIIKIYRVKLKKLKFTKVHNMLFRKKNSYINNNLSSN